MGYGLSLASSSALRHVLPHKSISIMGDGGFWHNGLSSGVSSAVFNHHDGLLIVVDNGYSAATGGQDIWIPIPQQEMIRSPSRMLAAEPG
jgi:indolepyruvate ferredoxin oxidoreductase alpha subunit